MGNLVFIFKQVFYIGILASVLTIIILLVKRVFGRVMTAKWQYCIWFLLIFRLSIPWQLQSPTSIYNIADNFIQRSLLVPNDKKVAISKVSQIPSAANSTISVPAASKVNKSTNVVSAVPQMQHRYGVMEYISLAWVIGVCILFVYTLFLNIKVMHKARKYKNFDDDRIQGILEECKSMMNIKHNIPILAATDKITPCLYGVIRPKILLTPEYAEKLTDSDLRYILFHELSHYKRKDILINWIVTLLQIIQFYNPFIWLGFYKMREDCEVACDEKVLRYIGEEKHIDYGKTIIKLLKLFSGSSFVPSTAGIVKSKLGYKRRILMISNFKKKNVVCTVLSITLIFAVGLTGLTACNNSEKNKKSKPSSTIVKAANDIKKPLEVQDNSAADNKQENETQANANTTAVPDKQNTTENTSAAQVKPVSSAKPADNPKPANNPKPSNASTPNVTPVSGTQNTPVATAQTYTSSKYGFSITFPANWSGRYRVTEDENGINVYFVSKRTTFKYHEYAGYMFGIQKKSLFKETPLGFQNDFLCNKDFYVKGIEFCLADAEQPYLDNTDEGYDLYLKIHNQILDVYNSLKAV